MIKPIQEKFGYVKRELRLKVFKLNLEVEKLKNKVAEANTERDSALDEAVVAWGELDALRAKMAKIEETAQEAGEFVAICACGDIYRNWKCENCEAEDL
jgi:hypothetical protein